jgi:prefoldin subunit 5
VKLLSSVLTGVAALGAYAIVNAPEAAAMRNEVVTLLSSVMPSATCKIDAVKCLEHRADELGGIRNKIAGIIVGLMDEHGKVADESKAADARQGANSALLAEGHQLWDSCGRFGMTVKWRGVTYTAPELKRQLQSLWDEKPALETTVAGLKKAATEVEDRIGELSAMRTKIAGEIALMTSRIASARAGALAGDFDRVLAEVDRLVSAADGATAQAAIPTLRTTEELDSAERKKEQKAQRHNPGFDSWLGGGTRN